MAAGLVHNSPWEILRAVKCLVPNVKGPGQPLEKTNGSCLADIDGEDLLDLGDFGVLKTPVQGIPKIDCFPSTWLLLGNIFTFLLVVV